MQDLLNIAVIGCGYWGPNLVRNFRFIPECSVRWVCDLREERLSYIKRLYPEVQVTRDVDSVLKDPAIDINIIATSVSAHFPLAKESLLAGKHTFVEKPIATSVPQCLELIDLAERKRLTLMVGHTFVYSPAVRKIKEIIERPDFGEIFYMSSQRLNLGLFQKDINVAWDLAPHDLSIILYISNQLPTSVNCQGVAHVYPEVESVTNMSLYFPNGRFAMIHNSWMDPNKVRKLTIVGSKRMIVYDDTEPLEKIKIYDKHVDIPPHYDTFAEFQFSYHYGDMSAPYIQHVEPLRAQCQHLIDCVRTGSKSDSSGVEGMQVVKILEAATKSLKTGGSRVSIDWE